MTVHAITALINTTLTRLQSARRNQDMASVRSLQRTLESYYAQRRDLWNSVR